MHEDFYDGVYHLPADSDEAMIRQRYIRGGLATSPVVSSNWSGVMTATVQKPSPRSKIEIEELDSQLDAGVRLKPLEFKAPKEEKIPSWPQVFYTHLADAHYLDEEKLSFILTIESLVKADDKTKPADIWYPIITQDMESCVLKETVFPKYGGKKFKKIRMKFLVKLMPPEPGKAHVPFVQFLCGTKEVRYSGTDFQKNDLVTVVVKHSGYPLHWPQPPILTVTPVFPVHYVPLMAKQKMVIVTKTDEYTCEYKPAIASEVIFDGKIASDFGRECNFFHCKKPSKSTELILFKNKKDKVAKRVIIPLVEKEVRCPVIMTPTRNAVIHSCNIDSFTIRFLKSAYHPIVVLSGTPVRHVFTNENALYIERRFEIEKRRPFIYLEKLEHSWIIR